MYAMAGPNNNATTLRLSLSILAKAYAKNSLMESSMLEGKLTLHAPLINATAIMAPHALKSAKKMLERGSSKHRNSGAKDYSKA